MKNRFNRCCCTSVPAQPYLWYGCRQALYSADKQRWATVPLATNQFPGLNLNAVRIDPSTFTNDLSYRPFAVATFPILAEKATPIVSATFHIRIFYYNTVPSRIAKWPGLFAARSTISTPADVQPVTAGQWEAVRNWTTATPIPFEVNHQPTFNDLAFDVTATAASLINNPSFVYGAPFAAVVQSAQQSDPLDVNVFNVGQITGLWSVNDIPPAVDPSPGGQSFQCWLKIVT